MLIVFKVDIFGSKRKNFAPFPVKEPHPLNSVSGYGPDLAATSSLDASAEYREYNEDLI